MSLLAVLGRGMLSPYKVAQVLVLVLVLVMEVWVSIFDNTCPE